MKNPLAIVGSPSHNFDRRINDFTREFTRAALGSKNEGSMARDNESRFQHIASPLGRPSDLHSLAQRYYHSQQLKM